LFGGLPRSWESFEHSPRDSSIEAKMVRLELNAAAIERCTARECNADAINKNVPPLGSEELIVRLACVVVGVEVP